MYAIRSYYAASVDGGNGPLPVRDKVGGGKIAVGVDDIDQVMPDPALLLGGRLGGTSYNFV